MSSASSSTCATTAVATTRRSVRWSGRSLTRQSTNPAGSTDHRPGDVFGCRIFATDLEQDPSVTFAGEDMGGSPNLFGDTRPVACRTVGDAEHGRRYWERSTLNDPRITIEPEIPAELTADDYFAGRDRCSTRSSRAGTNSD